MCEYTRVWQYVFLSMCTECMAEAKGGLQMAFYHLLHYSLQTSLPLNLEVGNQQASAILLSPSPTVLGSGTHVATWMQTHHLMITLQEQLLLPIKPLLKVPPNSFKS